MQFPIEYRWLKAHNFQLLTPWDDVEPDSDEARAFQNEYFRETGQQIIIFGRRYDQDDIVGFEINEESPTGRVLEVHLTWSRKLEDPGFPSTAIFESFFDWIKIQMFDDTLEWMNEDELQNLLDDED